MSNELASEQVADRRCLPIRSSPDAGFRAFRFGLKGEGTSGAATSGRRRRCSLLVSMQGGTLPPAAGGCLRVISSVSSPSRPRLLTRPNQRARQLITGLRGDRRHVTYIQEAWTWRERRQIETETFAPEEEGSSLESSIATANRRSPISGTGLSVETLPLQAR